MYAFLGILLVTTLILAPQAAADRDILDMKVRLGSEPDVRVRSQQLCIFVSPPDKVEIRPCGTLSGRPNPQA